MAQQTMTERDMYLAAFEREFQTTLRLLRHYPADKVGLKPSQRSGSAGEVAWTLVLSQHVVAPILRGELMPGAFPSAPATWPEILGAFEAAHRDALAALEGLGDEAMNGPVRMPTGPKQIGEVRRGDALWLMLNDTVHHRGQFSVYTRIAGGKVPSIYGPSGDEPWS
jgi:uncharacterized damage-inducible protein DinB